MLTLLSAASSTSTLRGGGGEGGGGFFSMKLLWDDINNMSYEGANELRRDRFD